MVGGRDAGLLVEGCVFFVTAGGSTDGTVLDGPLLDVIGSFSFGLESGGVWVAGGTIGAGLGSGGVGFVGLSSDVGGGGTNSSASKSGGGGGGGI